MALKAAAPTMFEALENRTLFSTTIPGYSPAQIQNAYYFNRVHFTVDGASIAGTGQGQTIAIVDAYQDPNVISDLQTFDKQFDIKNRIGDDTFALTVAQPDGEPPVNAGWALEESLDVEWAHAIAPKAKILLVEAASDDTADLLDAIDYARNQTGVVAVSMSWGGTESPFETDYDSYLTTPSDHIGGSGLPGGVTFVTSSGDDGPSTSWPAVSPNALAVGGTTLTLDSDGDYGSEAAWSGSGGGNSGTENTHNPDVAYDADPATGFAVYDSTPYEGNSGWQEVGGTSAGAPQWAALIAIADQGRALNGLGSLDGPSETMVAIYELPTKDFHQIPISDSSGDTGNDAGVLDQTNTQTGLGTPYANRIIRDLLKVT